MRLQRRHARLGRYLRHFVLVTVVTCLAAPSLPNVAYAATGVGQVSGSVYDDTNGNGALDAGESGIAGRSVFADNDDDGVFDAGEPSTTTNGSGAYTLTSVPVGTQSILSAHPSGWVHTGGPVTAVVTDGGTTANIRISTFKQGSIAGTVYDDTNGNGIRNAGEPGLSPRVVYFDANNNHVFDSGEVNTTTNSSGAWSFSSLAAGSYTVRVVSPDGSLQTSSEPAPVNIVSGVTATGVDFGLFQHGSITGTVFDDTNGNGVKDLGEPGHSNVSVFLDRNNNGVADGTDSVTTTDGSGTYLFTALEGGTFSVTAVLPSGYVATSANPNLTTVMSAGTNTNVNIGIVAFGAITGTVYDDANANGARDSGEVAAVGKTVFIDINENGSLTTGEPTSLTDSNGTYVFTDLPAGSYKVRLIVPTDSTQTTTNPAPTSVSVGPAVTGVDFGLFVKGSISGTVFNDTNGNGIRDSGESGFSGKTVFLDTNSNGALNAGEPSMVTDSQGAYSFTNMAAGSYRVRVVVATGTTQTTLNPSVINITSNASVSGADFGLFTQAQISGTVYNDVNANGVKDTGDAGIVNRTVFLDTNNNGALDAGEPNSTTLGTGGFSFNNLAPGNYRVRIVVPTTSLQTTANLGVITATSGLVSSGNEIGLFTYGTLSGTVYTDNNGNGTKDTGETGQSGRTVFLDADNDGVLDTGEVTATTGGTGAYTFTGLVAGTYRSRVVVPGSIYKTSADPAAVTVTSGTVSASKDFGFFTPATIGGVVYDDTNGNASKDTSEIGIGGVDLYLDANNNSTQDLGELEATTSSTGNYSFTGVNPGTYRVKIVIPSGKVQTTAAPVATTPTSGSTLSTVNFGLFGEATISGVVFDDVLGNGAKDIGDNGIFGRTVYIDTNSNGALNTGEPSVTTDANGGYSFSGLSLGSYRVRLVSPITVSQTTTNPASITPTSGSTTAGIDFGSFTLASITGTVYSDFDGNGVRASGEGGISSKTVFLDTNNNGSLTTGEPSTTTDVSGNYVFTGLGPGTYRPKFTAPGGSVQSSTDPNPVVLTSGTTATGNNFGLFTLGSISGTVYNDNNGSGAKEAGETGVNQRTVYIDANNNGIAELSEVKATTNSSGLYTFSGLGPGTYVIRLVGLAGTIQTSANPSSVVATSAMMVANKDFGVFTLGKISGAVYNDTNGNGQKGSGESGLAGRTVFIDADANGVLNAGEPTTVSDAAGAYTFTDLVPGSYTVLLAPVGGSMQTSPSFGSISISSGTIALSSDFGVFILASISGAIYSDTNADKTRNSGENGIAGITVFLDNNGNNVADNGEATVLSDGAGNYTFSDLPSGSYKVRATVPAGTTQTSAVIATITTASASAANGRDIGFFVLGTITGAVFDDLNGNGIADAGEPGSMSLTVYLDNNSSGGYNSGEPTATTNASGVFTFTGLSLGTYRPRVVVPTGKVLSSGLPNPIDITSGFNSTGTVFGLFSAGSISGTVFNDVDGNAAKDTGETGSASKVVYIDANNNGKKDTGETSATTSSTGAYTFVNLGPGSYTVLMTVPTGQMQTTVNPVPIIVTSGLVKTGVDFGVKTASTTSSTTTTTRPGGASGGTTTTTTTAPPPPPPAPTDPVSEGTGYWMAGSDGSVFSYGAAQDFGSAKPFNPTSPIVGMAPTPSGEGYQLVARDGGIFSFGDAEFYGSMGGQRLNQPMVSIAVTPTGKGYWTVASDGGVFSYGDAKFYGSTGAIKLNKPIVQIAATPTGRGYWMVATDGGIFAFGDAAFYGSTGALTLNKPIVGMARNGSAGYWLVASDGGIFAFGSAPFYGSMGSKALNQPVTAIHATDDGTGYWMFARDGGVFSFGSAQYYGGTPPVNGDIVS